MERLTVFSPSDDALHGPSGIIGAFGEVWFTSIADHRIGRVRADGVVQVFYDPDDLTRLPANIFPGADGRVWFTSLGSDRLGVIDPAAADPATTIVTFALPEGSRPVALKSAVDGLLWSSLRGANAIVSIDPRAADPLATLRWFRSPSIDAPAALFAAEDGRIWWVNSGSDALGVLDPMAGEIRALTLHPGSGSPRAWAQTADRRLWVTTRTPAGLLSFDPADLEGSLERHAAASLQEPDGVCVGPDGALWIADTGASTVVRFDPATASWTTAGAAPQVDGPFDIKPGPDASLWFTNKTGNTIGRLATGGEDGLSRASVVDEDGG